MAIRSKWSMESKTKYELSKIKGIDCWIVDKLVFDGRKWRLDSFEEFTNQDEARIYFESQQV